MISIVFASRKKDNPYSNLQLMFDSLVSLHSIDELLQVEFILKFDNDDTEHIDPSIFLSYPFRIKYVTYERGEGRHDIHNVLNYLFSLRDMKSRFFLNMADDFIFTRPFIQEVLDNNNEYAIIGGARCPRRGEYIAPNLNSNFRDVHSFISGVAEYCPIISTKVVEVVQNIGWQSSIDIWAVMLAIALNNLYNINIWHDMVSFYGRNDGSKPGNPDIKDAHAARYVYNDMEWSAYGPTKNTYFYDLVAQQAKNIYLNMKEDNII